MDIAIIPECYVDTTLIETLVPPKIRYNHQKGRGTVTKKMKDDFTGQFALGIIDDDKAALKYLTSFDLVVKKENLELFKHREMPHYIIRLHPAIEKFIISNIEKTNLSLTSFGLPASFEQFKSLTKRVLTKKDPRFIRLFKALSKENVAEIDLLKSWIIRLKENPYDTDLTFFTKS